eukprot:220764_1
MCALFLTCGVFIISGILSTQAQPQGDGPKDKYDVFKEEWCGAYNCYELLDVTPDVDFREIKQRYNNLSLALHPDKNPNASDDEKEHYVRINKAYEILGSKRRDYDEYLRLKEALNSPVESPILVVLFLYLGIAYVVLYYQRQQQKQCKDAILKNMSVIRYYWDEKKIDLTGKKKKSPKKGKKRGRKDKASTQSVCEIKDAIGIDEVNELISTLNLSVPGWKNTEPTYKQALIDTVTSVLWAASQILFQVRWILMYKVLKQSYSDSDREYLCRKHLKKSEMEWNAMPEADRVKLLNKPGKWKKRVKKNKAN